MYFQFSERAKVNGTTVQGRKTVTFPLRSVKALLHRFCLLFYHLYIVAKFPFRLRVRHIDLTSRVYHVRTYATPTDQY